MNTTTVGELKMTHDNPRVRSALLGLLAGCLLLGVAATGVTLWCHYSAPAPETAVQRLERLALEGDGVAALTLCDRALTGQHEPVNLVRAYAWESIAQIGMADPTRDLRQFAEDWHLSPAQVIEGERLATEWFAKAPHFQKKKRP